MTRNQRYALLLLRLALGVLFFSAGIVKLADPEWSAAGYLAGAQTLAGFYHWLASPAVLPITNALNAWGLTLIGSALILGVAVRFASGAGILMMALYYIPVLQFPHVGEHSYIVDEHVIYAVGLLIVSTFHAGRVWGLGRLFSSLPFFRRFRRTLAP